MRKLFMLFALMLAIPIVLASTVEAASAQAVGKTERVSFRPGSSSATVSRTIRGRETIDFLVNARAGQRLVVSMTSNNSSAYFNIIPPDQQDVADYVGSNSDPANTYSATLLKSGDTRIRVYLYRAAAMRGEAANVRLSIAVTGSPGNATQLPGTPPSSGGTVTQLPGDALVPGTPYNATGTISCVVRSNGPVGDCRYGVIRLGDGTASVTIAKLDGRSRTIIYRHGVPIGFDQAADEPSQLSWVREGSQTTVQIGGERYFVPDAVVYGG